jgi:hypothetical protein
VNFIPGLHGVAGLLQAGTTAALPLSAMFNASTWTGDNAATRKITTGINLAANPGAVWLYRRNTGAHGRSSTVQGTTKYLIAGTDPESTDASALKTFYSDGFDVGTLYNSTPNNYSSLTWRKAANFFDVVGYIGSGSTQTVAHALGSAPGMVAVRNRSGGGDWAVWHRSLTADNYILLNSAFAQNTAGAANIFGNNTAVVYPTASGVTVGSSFDTSGANFLMLLWGHGANITCGSYTGNGSFTGPIITLGWQPQFLMIKRRDPSSGDWQFYDTARGLVAAGTDAMGTWTNDTTTEQLSPDIDPLPTGFQIVNSQSRINSSGVVYLYMAIKAP